MCTIQDLCQAYYLALFNKQVVGQRVVISNKSMWYEQMFNIFRKHNLKYAAKLPTTKSPYFVIKIVSFFVKHIRGFLPLYGREIEISNKKSVDVLGVKYGDAEEALIALFDNMIEN